jgi:hypothetical protein
MIGQLGSISPDRTLNLGLRGEAMVIIVDLADVDEGAERDGASSRADQPVVE